MPSQKPHRRIPPRWQWKIRGLAAGWICKVKVMCTPRFNATVGAIWCRSDLSIRQRLERTHAEYLQEWTQVFYSDWLQRRVLGIRP